MDDLGLDLAGGDLPDIGAPDKGPVPPPSGGPGGGGPGAPRRPMSPSLPPPARPKGGQGGPAFAHYNPKATEFVVVRKGVSTKVGTRALIAEAQSVYPTHKVARLTRNGDAMINGKKYNLNKSQIAVITLQAK